MKPSLPKMILSGMLFSFQFSFSQNFGTALQFDGVNDRVEVPNNNNFLEPSNFTLEVWLKKDRINSPWGKDRVMISEL